MLLQSIMSNTAKLHSYRNNQAMLQLLLNKIILDEESLRKHELKECNCHLLDN